MPEPLIGVRFVRRGMVADRRLVARLRVEQVYGLDRPQYASTA
jgi:hypothetical protein